MFARSVFACCTLLAACNVDRPLPVPVPEGGGAAATPIPDALGVDDGGAIGGASVPICALTLTRPYAGTWAIYPDHLDGALSCSTSPTPPTGETSIIYRAPDGSAGLVAVVLDVTTGVTSLPAAGARFAFESSGRRCDSWAGRLETVAGPTWQIKFALTGCGLELEGQLDGNQREPGGT